MSLLIIDSALPLHSGNPRQRIAAARLAASATSAEHDAAYHATIDLWQTEWPQRTLMSKDELLFASMSRPQAADNILVQSWLTKGRNRDAEALDLDAPFPLANLDPRPINATVDSILARISPEQVIITDPLLAPLRPYIAPKVGTCALIPDRSAGWHRVAAARLAGSKESVWHSRLAAQYDKAVIGNLPNNWRDGFQLAWDDAFATKSPSILVPATNIRWLDERILSTLESQLGMLETRGLTPPELVLMGFPTILAARLPSALALDDWQHLRGMTGTSSALFIPFMTPELAWLARGSLACGTPVIAVDVDAGFHGLAGRPGVLAIGDPDRALKAMEVALNPHLSDAAFHQSIVAANGGRSDTVNIEPKRIERRTTAFAGRPNILYNPLSRMLLVQAPYRRSSHIEEVRLIGAGGRELNRLMPNSKQRALTIVPLEGGVVADPGDLDDGIRLELHDVEGLVEQIHIQREEFVTLDAELSFFHLGETRLEGAFWCRDEIAADRLGIGTNQHQAFLSVDDARPMVGLDASYHRFSMPISLTAKEELLVWRKPPFAQSLPEPVVQRPYRVAPQLIEVPTLVPDGLRALENRHKGARAWIIGNGPSVRHEDLSAIPSEDVTFCFNRFYLSHDDHELRENYVVSADTLMIRDFGQEMIERSPGLPLFCTNPGEVGHLEGDFVNVTPIDGFLPVFNPDPAKGISPGGSSVYVALQMAHYMGIRELVLYGIDYGFVMKLKRDPRFPFPVSFEDDNHFIKSNRSAKPWCPPTWRDISASFLNARVAFEATGGAIVNATRGGRLETFPRANFDEVVKRQTPKTKYEVRAEPEVAASPKKGLKALFG